MYHLRLLKWHEFNFRYRLNSSLLQIPLIKELGINNLRMDEWWMMDLMQLLPFGPHAQMIDVGANVGQSLLKWKSIYPTASYIGFEPLPKAFFYLEKLIHNNSWHDCRIAELALSSVSGQRRMHLHFKDPTDRTASFHNMPFKSIQNIAVQSRDWEGIKSLFKLELGPASFIKIDTEGSEKEILKMMLNDLRSSQAIVVFEWLECLSSDPSWMDLVSQFQTRHHLFKIIKKDQRLHALQSIQNQAFESGESSIDIVAIHKERDLGQEWASLII